VAERCLEGGRSIKSLGILSRACRQQTRLAGRVSGVNRAFFLYEGIERRQESEAFRLDSELKYARS
jgi:hypothetical protein